MWRQESRRRRCWSRAPGVGDNPIVGGYDAGEFQVPPDGDANRLESGATRLSGVTTRGATREKAE